MRAYLFLLGVQLKRVIQHRSDAIVWIIVAFLRLVVGVVIIFTVYSFIPEIEGIDEHTCILIYAAYSLVTSTFYMLFAWTLWYSNRYIVEGRLLSIVTKPVRPLLFIISENISREMLLETIVSLILFFVVSITMNTTAWQVVQLLFYLIPGVLTIAGFFLIASAIGSRVHRIEHAFGPAMTFMDFAQYPTSIYPKAIRFTLTWVVPYSLVAFIPIAVTFGIPIENVKVNLWWLPVYGVVIFCIGFASFQRSLRHFEATGS